ncbi:unnamed protein product [Cyprideis torosa]|uniref:Uncharacterized protein n=1 Tax=Cyprideis torosa TaxID=163714 RepID=A0A7R8ZSI6_9CRUS|nr:unnamed protein product [Cyprideis torosa]CAG0895617.1 unnamed protein product [Cyprideis torosa]
MNSEVEKEPSGFEILREDDGYAIAKFDGIEVLNDHKESTESSETAPLMDIVPGSMDNKNQTSVASDQIEVSEDEDTVMIDQAEATALFICWHELAEGVLSL